MGMFRTSDDIRQALADVGLSRLERDIVATALPAIAFVRRQKNDDDLSPGTSKMGGQPDLPSGSAWPQRPRLRDAGNRIKALRARRADERDRARTYGENNSLWADQDRRDDLLAASFERDFPLAFLAQFNLASLSGEAGFDLDLPHHGMLSLFEDITSDDVEGSVTVFWFDTGADQLRRQSAPSELIALSDAGNAYDLWADQTMAEVLEPHSVLTIPFHWREATNRHPQIYDFLNDPTTGFYPEIQQGEDEQVGYFGDRLGGWPVPIQSDPEKEFGMDPPARIEPGDDRIRHLVSWGGEYYSGTRRMHEPFGGDGTTYVMILRKDLLEARFAAAQAVYQCD